MYRLYASLFAVPPLPPSVVPTYQPHCMERYVGTMQKEWSGEGGEEEEEEEEEEPGEEGLRWYPVLAPAAAKQDTATHQLVLVLSL